MEEFFKIKSAVNTALCDSIDTRTVIEKIRELIAIGNAYINEMVHFILFLSESSNGFISTINNSIIVLVFNHSFIIF